jgi:hypothetical protein
MPKEIELMPSTIETIDASIHNWVKESIKAHVTTNKGWKRVEVIWLSAERAFQVKHNRDLYDENDVLKLPLITVARTGMEKSLSKKGTIRRPFPAMNSIKGGSLTVGRRIKQDKTRNYARADSKRSNGQANFPRKNQKVVYETVTIPLPIYVETTYDIFIRTEYVQQMNEILSPFLTSTAGINHITLHQDGHTFEGFIGESVELEDNASALDDEERYYSATISVSVLGYLMGADKNDDRPKIVVQENTVEVKMPRERIVLEDEHPFDDDGGFYR